MKAGWFLVSAALCLALAAPARASYQGADLFLPAGVTAGTAAAVSQGETAGYATFGTAPHALLWNGAANTVLDLDPGAYGSYLMGIGGASQFGYYGASQYSYSYGGGRGGRIHHVTITLWHAALWHGSDRMVDLNPSGAAFSYALAGYGNRQVGAAIFASPPLYDGPEYAYLWTGSAAGAVNIDQGYTWSQANCVGSANIGGVGSATIGASPHAILWTGANHTIVDLHPAAYPSYSSELTCIDDSRNQQGGFLYIYNSTTGAYDDTAFLWHGTPNGVSLAPAGSTESEVLGMGGGYQVGWATVAGVQHAFVWHGTAASAVDLGPGIAHGIDANRDVVGVSAGVPVVWKLSTVPHLAVAQFPEPLEHAWCNKPVTLSIQSPFVAGTPSITYHWDSSAPSTVAGSKLSLTQPSDGTHRLYVSATNGTKSTETSMVTVNIDRAPPITKETLAAGAFTLTPTDAGSGVAATYYSLDGGATAAYTGPVSVANVKHTLKYWSVDKVGNVEGAHIATLPVEPPAISSIIPAYLYAGSPTSTITVDGVDFLSTSVVSWNGKPLATTYVSGAELTAVIPASYILDPSTDQITVSTPNVGASGKTVFQVVDGP